MCGIAGIWSSRTDNTDAKVLSAQAMARAIEHRGPDGAGLWISGDHTLVLAHQRLAIQDLSALGHQPMACASGRYHMVFNGEIYNFKRLSNELQKKGTAFRGHSDTEVMLAAFEHWGIAAALEHFDGMFAFALYDAALGELWLARDRMGEKPLYCSIIDGELLFCSELKGLQQALPHPLPINGNAMGSYFRYGYFPVAEAPFQDVFKLPPASYCRLCLKDISQSTISDVFNASVKRYWNRPKQSLSLNTQQSSEMQILDGLEQQIIRAVRDQAVADVKVGVFLSGGIDSSLVAALLQKNSTQKINTFTIAFDSPDYNEAPYAKDIAAHIGSEHTEIPVAMEECLEVVKKLPHLLDEPFADASLIPSYLVCQAARKHVTVCLSGDGGDELFGGYNRYIQGSRLAQLASNIPAQLQNPLGQLLARIPTHALDTLYLPLAYLVSALGKKAEKDIGSKVHKIARALITENDREFYATLLSFWHESPLANNGHFPGLAQCITQEFNWNGDFAATAMECDIDFYLVCDNLFKIDRAAMANGLEVRLPLLDRAIVEYAALLPTDMKIRNGRSKWALRQVLHRHVPEALMDRPKMGFSVPLADWFRNGLKSWGEQQIASKDGLLAVDLNPDVVQRTWQEHQSGRYDHANALWTVLTYIQWRTANADSIAVGLPF
jgi:asparagine synthase (glutamine-hydrolysing)